MSRYFGTAVFTFVVSLAPLFAGAQSYYYPSGYSGYSGYNSPVTYSVQPTYQQLYGYQYPQQYSYYQPQQYVPQYQQQYYYQPQQQQQQQMQYQQYYQPQVQVQNQQQYQPTYYTQQYTGNSNNPPSTGSYPTGDRDAIGNQLCYYPSYGARYSCDSDPHQWVYDYWTGTWY